MGDKLLPVLLLLAINSLPLSWYRPRTRLSLVTTTPAKSTSVSVNVLNISANFRKKFEMVPIGYSGDKGELIRGKKSEVENLFSNYL